MVNLKSVKSEKRPGRWMKRTVGSAACALLIMTLLFTGNVFCSYGAETEIKVHPGEVHTQAVNTDSEMRGIWVASVYNLDYPSKPTTSSEELKAEADTVIRDCYDLGMNAIFLQVRPTADALYQSSYFPWSTYLTGQQGTAPDNGFDPLEYWVEKAHERGMELHAWINPYRITKSSGDWEKMTDYHPAKGAYSNCVIKYNGNYYFDPGRPESRELITAGAAEIVSRYNVDGIHFDDYFYPEQSSGAAFNDDASYAEYGNGMNRADWRRENVNQLIRMVNQAVHAVNSHCVFGVSPPGVWANSSSISLGSATRGWEAYSALYADSYTWIKNHWIDYIAPQIYWEIGNSSADYQVLVNWWTQVAEGTGVQCYIGMADYRADASSGIWKGTSELLRQLKLNDEVSGVGGEIHYRYKSVAGSTALFNFYKNVYASSRVPANTDPQGVEPSSGLYDIFGHWAEEYILSLVNAGVISGMGDGTFRPNNPVTRAQFVKMLAVNAGASDFETLPDAGFEDVDSASWFSDPIKWAVSKGIVSGRSRKSFAPDENITRQEMAVMLRNYCDAMGLNSVRDFAAVDFTDKTEIALWAAEAVDKAAGLGLVNGIEVENSVYFYPERNSTRAEAAKVISILRGIEQNADSSDSGEDSENTDAADGLETD